MFSHFKLVFVSTFLLTLVIATTVNCQPGLPKYWEKCVVVIEKEVEYEKGIKDFHPHGTGFLYADTKEQRIFLITNRHVLSGRQYVFLRLGKADYDPAKDSIRYFRYRCQLIDSDGHVLWKGHPNGNIDIGACELHNPGEKPDAREFVRSRFKDFDDLTVGDDVYFYGFPLLISPLEAGEDIPVLRSGIVSFKANERTHIAGGLIDSGIFLIDGFSYGGNSGSPVLTKAKGNEKAGLIGIVYGHVEDYPKVIEHKPYPITLPSGDTITIELPPDTINRVENVGLAKAISAGMILETLDQFKVGD